MTGIGGSPAGEFAWEVKDAVVFYGIHILPPRTGEKSFSGLSVSAASVDDLRVEFYPLLLADGGHSALSAELWWNASGGPDHLILK